MRAIATQLHVQRQTVRMALRAPEHAGDASDGSGSAQSGGNGHPARYLMSPAPPTGAMPTVAQIRAAWAFDKALDPDDEGWSGMPESLSSSLSTRQGPRS